MKEKNRIHRKHSQQAYRRILGVTLSKRGWNNVLIYLVLALMFMFHFLGQDKPDKPQETTYLPFENSALVALQAAPLHAVRVGNQWQAQGDSALSQASLDTWVSAWQTVELQATEQLLAGQEYYLEVTLADQAPFGVAIFVTDETYLVAFPQFDEVFKVVSERPEQLLLPWFKD